MPNPDAPIREQLGVKPGQKLPILAAFFRVPAPEGAPVDPKTGKPNMQFSVAHYDKRASGAFSFPNIGNWLLAVAAQVAPEQCVCALALATRHD